MKRLILAGLTVLALLMGLPLSTVAQLNPNLENGVKPYGSYDSNDFDTVSIYNGNLFLHIPLLSYPQRGSLSAKFDITYNGKNFYVFQWCNTILGTCQSKWMWGVQGSLGYPPGISIRSVDTLEGTNTYEKNYPPYNWSSALTWDGAIHDAGYNGSGAYFETLDGSDIRIPSAGRGLLPNGNLGNVEDSNGNEWTSDANNSYDTLARHFPVGAETSTTDFTGCTGPLATTSASIYNYPGINGGTLQVKKCYANGAVNTNFRATNNDIYGNTDPIQELHQTVQFLQTIIIYDGNSWTGSPAWKFTFDAGPVGDSNTHYGDLLSVTLPTGGTISYAWGTVSLCVGNRALIPVSRGVTSRTLNANDGLGPLMTTFSGGTVTDPLGNQTIHTFTALGFTCSLYETQTDYYQGSRTTGTLLKTVKTNYQYQEDTWDRVGDGTKLATQVFPTSITTIWPNGLQSQVQYTYDTQLGTLSTPGTQMTGLSYGKPSEMREYDYGTGAPGPLLRRTGYTYVAFNNSSYRTANMLDRVATETVYNGSGVQVAMTTYGYDEYGVQTSGAPQHTTPPSSVRGNRTSVKRWLNITGGTLNTTTTYFDTGMPYQLTDPAGKVTSYTYSSAYANAYLTQTQLPDTSSPNLAHHIISATYDYNTGRVTSFTDENAQTSNYQYDTLWRASLATFPNGGQTTLAYPDLKTIELQMKITSSLVTDSYMNFDGLGRLVQTRMVSDPEGVDYVDTTYDVLGRTASVSNPYRNVSESTYGVTQYQYDALGRTTKVIPPDGTTSANNVQTSYTGNCATVTDQVGNARKSCTDGLGRLTQVFEAPGSLNYETDNQYDALGNLTRVDQKGGSANSADWRTRTFTYDSLSRLLTASNPESGAIGYAYDYNDNLLTKVSPAPNQTGTATETISYCYDELNRLTAKAYTLSPATPPTCSTSHTLPSPAATYSYDQTSSNGLTITNGTGRRTSMADGSGSTAWTYDPMGRVLDERRTINGNAAITKDIGYSYNLDGSVATLIYPSGSVLTYSLSSGGTCGSSTCTAARTVSAIDQNGTPSVSTDDINYVTSATYAPTGALAGLINGFTSTFPGISTTNTYNKRLQPITLSANTPGFGTIFSRSYDFQLNVGDNGNVFDIVNNLDNNRTQNFTYDTLNRIATAYSSGPNWGETFTIDPWGNLTNRNPISGKTSYEPLNAPANSKNQLSGYSYDAAGNMTGDGVNSYGYDPENRIGATAGVNYTYDGDGKRVVKSSGKIYWTGTGADPLTETDLNGTPTADYILFSGKRVARRDLPSGNVHYYFSDQLGSASIVTDAVGTWGTREESDYYPYGGEMVIANGDTNAYKFTGKERDAESGLDYFGARYYGSNMGRFTSPDEFPGGPVDLFDVDDPASQALPYADITNPQSLNKYSYTYNNPLRYTDPDGHCPECIGDLIELVAQNPQAVQATLDGIANATAATETAAETGLRVGGSTLAAGFLALTYLANPGSGGLTEDKDTIHFSNQEKQQSGTSPMPEAAHRKGARPSTTEKHQRGTARKNRDRGSEKGDKRREEKGMFPRKPPGGWKGPWPPKPPEPPKPPKKKTDTE